MKRLGGIAVLAIVSLFAMVSVATAHIAGFADGEVAKCKSTEAFCFAPQLGTVPGRVEAVNVPKIATPAWMNAAAAPTNPVAREVTYQTATKGSVHADFNEFISQVNETLNSPNGWSRLGVRFVRVETGGQFTVWLTEASQVPSFSPSGCDAIVSCTVGNNVIINEVRWLNGSDAWNGAGGSLRNYRHMVVNHETGHWLGHGHEYCSGAGQLASVMQQQTIDMQGCAPNPWPLPHEIYSPKLGIRS